MSENIKTVSRTHSTIKLHHHPYKSTLCNTIFPPVPESQDKKWLLLNTQVKINCDTVTEWQCRKVTFKISQCSNQDLTVLQPGSHHHQPSNTTPLLFQPQPSLLPLIINYQHWKFYISTSHFHSHHLPKPVSTFLTYQQVHSCHYHTLQNQGYHKPYEITLILQNLHFWHILSCLQDCMVV